MSMKKNGAQGYKKCGFTIAEAALVLFLLGCLLKAFL